MNVAEIPTWSEQRLLGVRADGKCFFLLPIYYTKMMDFSY